jgi:hypothetical protein
MPNFFDFSVGSLPFSKFESPNGRDLFQLIVAVRIHFTWWGRISHLRMVHLVDAGDQVSVGEFNALRHASGATGEGQCHQLLRVGAIGKAVGAFHFAQGQLRQVEVPLDARGCACHHQGTASPRYQVDGRLHFFQQRRQVNTARTLAS